MLDINLHKLNFIQVLKEIYSDTSVGPVLGFKGGTAAYLFYGLERFSVDLDFDLLDIEKEEYIFGRVGNIVQKMGLLKEKYNKRSNLFYLLSYQKGMPNIKVEINKRDFGSRYKIENYLGVSMQVMIREDMFANKLAALLDRKKPANRDVFDAWFFLKNNWPINERMIEKRTGVKLKNYLKRCEKHVERIDERQILAGLGELLNEKQKIWAKKNLKKDLLFLLKLRASLEK